LAASRIKDELVAICFTYTNLSNEDEAFDAATSLVLAPSDGPASSDNPPEPLPLKEQEAVYKRLEAIELAERKREERISFRLQKL
jgi:hypothetical protein